VYLLVGIIVLPAQINIWAGTGNKRVDMTPYLVKGEGHPAVIICPGGSYFWHDMETEGTKVAEWLNQNGISAFVLRYRTAGVPAFVTRFRYVFRGNRYPDPQEDLCQALSVVHEQAVNFGVDESKIGVMGFSAGGHLVMSVTEMSNVTYPPMFVASIYPVVTMTEACTHKRSRRALLGESRKNNKRLRDLLSLEKHVTSNCPPIFLVNCVDDPIVDYRNSELLDSALTEKGIPHKYIQFKTGGHGFGASQHKGSEEARSWKVEFINWLKQIL